MKKILVIDDAEFILESTSTLLRFEGYDVAVATDGIEGIDQAAIFKPDLILCDISMPRLDGYGVLDRIRSDSFSESIPFIFLTAFTEKANMRAGMEKGADDFLVKPYTRDELIAAIEAQWDKHSRIVKQVHEKVEEVGKNLTMVLPHEFRTVLNEVIGTARYLNNNSDNLLPGDIKESSTDIISSAKRLLKITENFLIYSQMELISANPKKKLSLLNSKAEEPSAILSDVVSLVAQKYERISDIAIGGLPESIIITITSESFYKIIDELLDNAFRFSDPGSIVSVHATCENNLYSVSIEDKGRGMTAEQISGVAALAQFGRDLHEQQGVGLGLAIAKKMTELYSGTFVISSKVGEGTTVTFSLPIC